MASPGWLAGRWISVWGLLINCCLLSVKNQQFFCLEPGPCYALLMFGPGMFAIPNRVFPRRFASVTADKSCWTASAMRCVLGCQRQTSANPQLSRLCTCDLLRSSVGRRKKLPRSYRVSCQPRLNTFWCLKAMQKKWLNYRAHSWSRKNADWRSTTRSSIPRSPSCLQRGLLFRCSSVGPSLYSLVSNYYYYCIGPSRGCEINFIWYPVSIIFQFKVY